MTVPDEGTFAVRAEPAAAATATAATGPSQQRTRWLLPAGTLLLVAVLAVYLTDLVTHLPSMAAMRDLVVYRDGGLIVRHVAPAYDGPRSWHGLQLLAGNVFVLAGLAALAALAVTALRLRMRQARNPVVTGTSAG
jgi:hypothetical protein